MQRYFLKSLVGFFLVAVVSSRIASGHSLSFLRALAEEDELLQEESMEETNIDSANALGDSVIARPKSTEPKGFEKNYVNVELHGAAQKHTIYQGQSYELLCKANGSPEPKVHWLRGSNPTKAIAELFKTSVPSELSRSDEGAIARVESKYVIDCASQQDEGPIHCVAIAGQKTALVSTDIIVKENSNGTHPCKSHRAPVVSYYTNTLLSEIGSTVILPCRAEGIPRPRTRWVTLNGSTIINHRFNDRYKILNNGDLLIENLEWSDMGGPKCIAESSAGVDSAETFLYPLKPSTE